VNTNLFHNIANVLIVVSAMATAALLATGCVQPLIDGPMDCSASFIDPTYTAIATGALGVIKMAVNIFRDGFSGLTKPQPPVVK
jgi:hypothetical protein